MSSQRERVDDDDEVALTTTTTTTTRRRVLRRRRRRTSHLLLFPTVAALAVASRFLRSFEPFLLPPHLPEEEAGEDSSFVDRQRLPYGQRRALSKKEHRHHHKFRTAIDEGDFSSYSCDSLRVRTDSLPRSTSCDYAKTCNDYDGIYAPVVFCDESRSVRSWMILLGPPFVLFLTILFRVLGSTAEEFFSPGLEMFSLELGLPERFAGVTLLALGNGAPDVASTVNAVVGDRKRGYLLALGELTGTAMVVSVAVLGVVTYLSNGVECRGPLVRDVSVFVLTMIYVYWSFEDGTATKSEIDGFLVLYAAYVLVVLAADVYHRKVVEPKLGRRTTATGTVKSTGGDDHGGNVGMVEASPAASKTLPEGDGTRDEPNESTKLLVRRGEADRTEANGGGGGSKGATNGFVVAAAAAASKETKHEAHRKTIGNIERMIEALSNYDIDSNGSDEEDDYLSMESASANTLDGSGFLDVEADVDEETMPASTRLRSKSLGSEPSHKEKTGGGSGGKKNRRPRSSSCAAPRRGCASVSGWAKRDKATGAEPLMVFHPHRGGIVDLKHAPSFEAPPPPPPPSAPSATPPPPEEDGGAETTGPSALADVRRPGEAPNDWTEAFVTAKDELARHGRKFWSETYGCDECSTIDRALITCELPFTLARMLTIPVPCDGYYCRPLVAVSIALSPLWMWFYCIDQFGRSIVTGDVGNAFLVFGLPFALGLAVLRYAPRGEVPMRLSAAVPITTIGFVVSASWLDLVADRLVSLLSFFGIMMRVPATVMGLTVLAWGNSSQDLIANATVAKKGLSAMAVTACFAGPVFNVLVGLGLGLTILRRTSDDPTAPIDVNLNGPLRVGFLFSVLNGALVMIFGVCVGKGVVPKTYGFAAAVLYAAYVAASLTL